jgi:Ca2+-dependent lipid-binding protein
LEQQIKKISELCSERQQQLTDSALRTIFLGCPTMSAPFTGSLKIRVVEATNLAVPAGMKTIDAYLAINIDETAVFQTTTKSKSLSPKWNELVRKSCASSTPNRRIVFHMHIYLNSHCSSTLG